MSQYPFGFGNRLYSLDSIFNERAAPRMPGPQRERSYRHPVVPISSTDTPHYAQASQLYPMRTSSERDNIYRYKPVSGFLGQTNPTPSSPGTSGQAIVIPVVHVGASRTSSSSSLGNLAAHSSGGPDGGSSSSTPSTPQPDNSESNMNRTPTYRTSSVVPSGGGASGTRTVQGRSAPPPNDPEAEVDALTNLLMQSMETRSPSSAMTTSGTMSSSTVDASNSSPAGSLRRGSGSATTIGVNPQLGRLQQHIGLGSASGFGPNGGRGSPHANSGVNVPSTSGSPSTNSPTESTSSVHNAGDNGGSTAASSSSTHAQNVCFRCRRSLVPFEGSTLSGGFSSNNGSNVVTLTGALGVRLHVACFTCYRCAAPLRTDGYYHNLRRLLCPACVRDGAVETCCNCHRPIGDRVVHALGMPYHPNCFVCVVCAGRLDSRPFTIDIHGRLHCLTDFHKRYAPRCASCGKPIAPEPGSQEARRVVSGNLDYHLECFGVQMVSHSSNLKSPSLKLSGSVAG